LKSEKNSNNVIYIIIGAIILACMVFRVVISNGEKYSNLNTKQPAPKAKPQEKQDVNIEDAEDSADAGRSNEELIKDLKKNPHNPSAWQALYENHAKMGDTVSARKAKESYEKAVRNQRVLSSLAKAFGNDVRVEITEDAVLYRTSRDFSSDDEFYHEAARLRDSLSVKFKGRKLIVENYDSKNRVQHLELSP